MPLNERQFRVRLLYSLSRAPGCESEARSGRGGGDHGGWARFMVGQQPDMVWKLEQNDNYERNVICLTNKNLPC